MKHPSQATEDSQDSQKNQVDHNVTMQVPELQQMPLPGTEEPGEDLRHAVAGHPWPWILHCKTDSCQSWIYLRKTQWYKHCMHCGELWSESIKVPGLLEKKDRIHKSNKVHCLSRLCTIYGWLSTSWDNSFWPTFLDRTMHAHMAPSAVTQGSWTKRLAATRSLHLSTQCVYGGFQQFK